MAKNYVADTDYKIGSALSNLVPLRMMNISVPDQVTYRPASIYYVRADLTRIGDGFTSVTWVWDMMSYDRISKLLSFLSFGDYGYVFIKTDIRDGTIAQPRNAFKVYNATMWKPILSGEEGVPVARSPYVLQTVQLKFVNLVEQIGYL